MQKRAPITEFPVEGWHEVMNTNLHSVFYVTQAVTKRMVPRKRGKIINIGSVMSELGRATIIPYTASKGAVKMMTRGLAAELGKHNIQANAIGPGYFATEINAALIADEAFSNWVCSRTPAGRWGETKELVGAAIFLSSAASDYVNGHLLMVDGGLTCGGVRLRRQSFSGEAERRPENRHDEESAGASSGRRCSGKPEHDMPRSGRRLRHGVDDIVHHALDEVAVVALGHHADHRLGAGRADHQAAALAEQLLARPRSR